MQVVKLEDFQAGKHVARYQYESFEPNTINHGWNWNDPVINTLLETASAKLGALNGLARIVPNISLFTRMHIVKEAQTSSTIEGTQTSMQDALLPVEEVASEARDDWTEVHNYIRAMRRALAELSELPISGRLIRLTHATLLAGVRGEHKNPGEFRITQNWIGGSSLADAMFIPPHHESVPDLMSDLEAFWHNDKIAVPMLIRAAISHYQFETIHPFLDGNGRVGRLLIVLHLIDAGLLEQPALYLSDFFERHRAQYYDALMRVRTSNDLVHWVKFFLSGIIETATKGATVFQQIFELRGRMEQQVAVLGQRTATALAALDHLYQQPLCTAGELAAALEISVPTANRLVRDFVELGILTETTGRERNRRYLFKEYFSLFLN